MKALTVTDTSSGLVVSFSAVCTTWRGGGGGGGGTKSIVVWTKAQLVTGSLSKIRSHMITTALHIHTMGSLSTSEIIISLVVSGAVYVCR